VNEALVRQEFSMLLLSPLPLRMNHWAPAADFSLAWSAELQPAASEAANQTFLYEVDSVRVQALPEPDARAGLAAALLGLLLLAERRTRRSRAHGAAEQSGPRSGGGAAVRRSDAGTP
jgi:hypothetical protein